MLRIMKAIAISAAMTILFCAHASGQQGRTVFTGKGNCFTCHGTDGKGTPLGPDLTDGTWLNGDGSLESILGIVRTGVPKPKKYPAPMPPMGGARLSRAEIAAVAAYVLELSAREPQASAASRRSPDVRRRRDG